MRRAGAAAGLICGVLLAPLSPPALAQPPVRYYWYDGDVRRPLYLDETQRATFDERRATRETVLAPPGMTRGAPAAPGLAIAGRVSIAQSPVFRDAPGGRERALPGGVIVTLASALASERARALLVADGLQPVRQLGEGSPMWLVGSPPGLPTLELANRLHESGRYRSASPNWWQPRRLK